MKMIKKNIKAMSICWWKYCYN